MSGFEQSYSIRSDLIADAERRLALAQSHAGVIEAVRETGRGVCKCDGISLVLRDGEMCHYVEEDAIGPLWKGQRFPLSACISGWSMLSGETAVIEDVFEDPRIPYDAYLPTFVKSLIMTPVGEGRVAAIGAYWKERRQFSELEIMRVKNFSAIVGKALSDILSRD